MSSKRFIKPLLTTLILAMAFVLTPLTANAADWRQEGNDWYYILDDGSKLTNGWHYDSAWYYFGADGKMVTGLQNIGSHSYYFCEKDRGSWKRGQMMTGWQFINNDYMYFDTNGYYHEECKGDENSIKGIDVSQYQGNMDWTKVKNQGISFAFIRVGHGAHEVDPYFVKNIDNANAVGIKVGVYFYSTAQSVEESRADALWVIDQLKGHTVSYPVAIDLESNSQVDLGWETITAMAKVFCDEVKAAGYTPMIYANTKYMIMGIDLEKLLKYDKWFACYSDNITFPYNFQMLQYSEKGSIPGIKGDVDLNISFIDYSKGNDKND